MTAAALAFNLLYLCTIIAVNVIFLYECQTFYMLQLLSCNVNKEQINTGKQMVFRAKVPSANGHVYKLTWSG